MFTEYHTITRHLAADSLDGEWTDVSDREPMIDEAEVAERITHFIEALSALDYEFDETTDYNVMPVRRSKERGEIGFKVQTLADNGDIDELEVVAVYGNGSDPTQAMARLHRHALHEAFAE